MVTSVTSNGSFAFQAIAALQVIGFPAVSYIHVLVMRCGQLLA